MIDETLDNDAAERRRGLNQLPATRVDYADQHFFPVEVLNFSPISSHRFQSLGRDALTSDDEEPPPTDQHNPLTEDLPLGGEKQPQQVTMDLLPGSYANATTPAPPRSYANANATTTAPNEASTTAPNSSVEEAPTPTPDAGMESSGGLDLLDLL